jgi:hypothetical protein
LLPPPPKGAFTLPSGAVLPVPDSLENAGMRLYGGAQFHRAMAEFRAAVGQVGLRVVWVGGDGDGRRGKGRS